MDTEYDMCRSVSDGEFIYINNCFPEKPWIQDIDYRKKMPMMKEMLELHRQGSLDSIQEIWFRKQKTEELLYYLENDPYEINNLAYNPHYKQKVKEFRNALSLWKEEFGDKGEVPEYELVERMWPDFIQPITEQPVFKISHKHVKILCNSVVYCFKKSGEKPDPEEPNEWKLYTGPLKFSRDQTLYALANRIGFKNSKMVKINLSDY